MLSRLIPPAVVAFWLASLGWLGMAVWAPPESRMTGVNPREVYDVFFSWNESTRMTLLDNGSRRGELNLGGSSGEDRRTGVFSNSLSVTGSLDALDPDEDKPGIDLFWNGFAEFSRELEFLTGKFSVRLPSRKVTAHLEMEGNPPVSKAAVTINGVQILEIDSSKSPLNAELLKSLPLGSMLGVETLDPGSFAFEVEARMGNFSFGGRDLRAYLLIVKVKDREESLKIFLSEAGEPLRITTDFGFEAVSEILVPLDAYLPKK